MLTIVRGRSWSFDATIFDVYLGEGDPGNEPTNHTGWTIRSQIRKKVGNVLVANLNVTFPVPTAGTVAIRHDRDFTRSLPVGDYWWDIVATDPSGEDHVYVEPEPIAVHDHPTDPSDATFNFIPGGGGVITHTHVISDITGLEARLAPTGGTIARYLRGDNTWQLLNKAAVGLGSVENVALSTANLPVVNAGLGLILSGKAEAVHTHPAVDISDSTATGRSLLTAAAASDARTTLGVGTSDSPTFGGADLFTSTTTTLNVYNILSGPNFERLAFRWASNVARIGTAKGGTGTARDLVIETDATERMRVSASGAVSMGSNLSVTGSVTSASGTIGSWTIGTDISATMPGGSLQISITGAIRFGGAGERIYNSGSAIKIRNSANTADAALTCSNLTASADVEVTDSTKGVILKSPDGTRYRVTVANGGGLTTTAV